MSTWRSRLLRVNLAGRTWRSEELDPKTLEQYLGGRGLGVHLLRQSGRHVRDPLHPDVPLLWTTGPLTGTRAPTASRTNLTSVSPLTGTVFDSNSGGFFGIRLKRAGYDALWVEGAAETPLYLVVEPDGVRFEDAGHLWGRGNRETQVALVETEGRGAALLTIGPAGESGSLLANIAHGHRFFGRGGLGASMGLRGLKALVVRGDGAVEVADPDGFAFIANECRKWLDAHPVTGKGLPQFGTAVLMNVINEVGILPVRNFRGSLSKTADRVSGEALRDRLLRGRQGCPGCPITCGRKIEIDGSAREGPEFETLWALGANLGVDDLDAIARLNAQANDLGLDTVSAGSTIGAARELFERGLLEWDPLAGGPEGVARILEEMARGVGPGEVLRHGSRRLGAARGCPEVSMSSKGLELPAYDPRGCQGQGLAYATSNRGGCHLRAYMVAPEVLATPKLIDRFASSGKGGLTIVFQNTNAAVDSLILCRFTSFALKDEYYARLVRAATGLDLDAQGFQAIGERIYNLERLVNLERGMTRDDDALPERLLRDPIAEGPSRGHTVALAPMLDEYYRFRGWDDQGRPTAHKLSQLGLEPTAPGRGTSLPDAQEQRT